MFEVKLKPGHPTGIYRRSGKEFTAEPVKMRNVTEEMQKDPWLKIVDLDAKKKSIVPTLEEFVKAGYKTADYENMFFGLKPGDEYDLATVEKNRQAAQRKEEERKRLEAEKEKQVQK